MKLKIGLYLMVGFSLPVCATQFNIINKTDGQIRVEIFYVAPSALCADDVITFGSGASKKFDAGLCMVSHLTITSLSGKSVGKQYTPANSSISGNWPVEITITNENGVLSMSRKQLY